MKRIFAALLFYIETLKVANAAVITSRRTRRNIRDFTVPKNNKYFPYSAIALLNNGCSGTLISCKHILTAAHCMHDDEKSVDVEAGLVDTDGIVKWSDVNEFQSQEGERKTIKKNG